MATAVRQQGQLSIDGARLECCWLGPGPDEALTLVLLHEGLGCVAMWKEFPARLAEATGCGVLVYSRLGHGGSDPAPLPRPLDYMEREAVQVLPKVLDTCDIRRAILVGHSDGASIATIYSGSVEDHRVRGLVLIAPHFLVEERTLAGIRAARDAFEQGELRRRLERHHGANVDGAFWGWNRVWLDPTFRHWSIEDCLAYIRVPILIIQGTDDPYGTQRQIEAAREETYCPVDLCLLQCGHAPHAEQPDATLAAVTAFVRRLVEVHGEDPRRAAPVGMRT